MDGLISVVIPTFNRSNTLMKAIDSVLAQTYKNYEIIIVDDASTDNTDDIVKQYLNCRDNIKYIKGKCNKGANHRRNQGIKEAKGNYIAFLDSDNYWESKKLEKQLDRMQENVKAGVCFCRFKLVEDEHHPIRIVPDERIVENQVGDVLKKYNVVDTSTLLIKKDLLLKAGGFDEKIPRFQDYELIFRLIYEFQIPTVFVDEVLVTNVLQENSITKNNQARVDACIYFIEKFRQYFDRKQLSDWIALNLVSLLFMDDLNQENAEKILMYLTNNDLGKADAIYDVFMGLKKKNIRLKVWDYWLDYDWQTTCEYMKNRKVAIYGMGKMGKRLLKELERYNIPVEVIIDKKVESCKAIPVIKPTETFNELDLIIISVMDSPMEIKKKLEEKYDCEVWSLRDMLEESCRH